MKRLTTHPLVLASALSFCVFSSTSILASRSADEAVVPAQEQPLAVAAGRPGAPAGPAAAAQNPVPSGLNRVNVLIELQQDAAAVAFAEVLERAPARNPQAIATAAAAGRQQISVVAAQQAQASATLAAAPFNATEMFRVQRAMNGIAVTVDAASLNAITRLAGVKAVHLLELEYPMNSSSVPFLGAPVLWDNSVGLGGNVTGAGIRVGIIDTGIDYQHATFGGTGLLADYQANDRSAAPDAYFPTAKVVGGWDFVGDAYNGSNAPAPDADPMDCNGHGTHVAGTAAGYGVTSAGATFAGPFGVATPFASLRIGPGTAPQTQLYGLRVFGCGGGTNVTVQAIDWAMDPNGDTDLSDHLDVLNMSLGSNFGGLTSSSAVAADNAARAGIIVVTSAGNSGDTYFISGSPGSADRVIATAASVDNGQPGAGLRVNTPPGIAGHYVVGTAAFGSIPPDGGLSGNVVLALDASDADGPLTTDGCTSLTNAAAVAGHIALIDRGTCGYTVKTKNAQDAGATGVIIANSSGGTFGNMGGSDPAIVIPAVMVTFADGNTLKANIASLNVTLFNGGDTISSFSSRGPRGGSGRVMMKPDLAAPGYQIVSAQTGVTCTGSGASTGCQTASGSGYLADSPALTLNGTSMAAPHVAGIMALLRQLHPTWTVEELKALAMNRSLHDVTKVPAAAARVGPGRVGAGRVDAALAAQSSVIAFNAEEPGVVSLSFENPVVGTATRQKKVRLVNHGTSSQTYDLAVDVVADAPGVVFSAPGGASVVVPAGQSVELTVQMDADASQMDHSRDDTVDATQTAPSSPASVATLGTLNRHWITEEAGYLVLSQGGQPRLRVPLYSAPAPVAEMSAPDAIATGGAPTGSTTIPLSGTGVCTGTLGAGPTCTGSFPTDVVSLVTPFELQVSSPPNPAEALPWTDLQYAGVAYSAATDQLLFGVSTWGAWKTPTDTAFNIYIDCGVYTNGASFAADTCNGVPDGNYDLVLFNTNPGSLAQLFGVNTSPQDSFITAVFVMSRTSVVFGPPNYVNRLSAGAADTRVFDNQVMMLAADRTRLKVSSTTGTFRYRVLTCPGSAPLCFALNGYRHDEAAGPYTWNYLNQGLDFGGGNLFFDLNGASLPVTWNTANVTANGSLGGLLLHHHNTEGTRAEVILLDNGLQTDLGVTLTASTATPVLGEDVTLTITVTNHGSQNATGAEVLLELPPGLNYVSDDGGSAFDAGLGKWTLPAPLAASAQAALHVVVSADASTILNARASAGAASPLDPNPANNVATLGVMPPPQSDVQVTAVATSGTVMAGGGLAAYDVTVRNNGVSPAYNIAVTNIISAGAGAIQSGTPGAGVFDLGSSQWTIASLGVGSSATLSLTAVAVSGPALTLQATGSSAAADPDAANNVGSASVAVTPRPTAMSVTLDGAAALVDDTRTATLTVSDTGMSPTGNPAGTVTLSSPDAALSVSPGSCALVPVPATTDRASCQIAIEASTAGSYTLLANYPGSGVHSAANGSASLAVDLRPTTTTAVNATALTGDADQVVTLHATVTSSIPVDSGIVTFTVKNGANAVIGAPAVSTALVNATATASFTLPGGTAAQTLTIEATYTDAAGQRFEPSSDVTKTLVVSAPPITTRTYTLAEGATGEFFDTSILIANPNATEAPITIVFEKEDGTTLNVDRAIAAMSRATIVVEEITGLEAAAFSTVVTSTHGLPLVVERTVAWGADRYGTHAERAVESQSDTWYFAEGAQGFFSTFLLFANTQSMPNVAHVTYFREGLPPLTRDYPIEARARRTIDLGTETELVGTAFGMRVVFDYPAFAERATYFGTSPMWSGGHGASGVPAPSTSWLFAEGATGNFFTTFLLLANTSDDTANVTVRYLPADGAAISKSYGIPAQQRLTLNIGVEDPSLAFGAIGAEIISDRPVVAERAQYWPQPSWYEGHSSSGIPAAGLKWGFAEGSVGGGSADQTYILLMNPGAVAADVTATFLRVNGAPLTKTFTVAPHSRRNVWIGGAGSDVPELIDEAFGVRLESTQPIAAERSQYSNAGGVIWAAGTNVTATPIP
jgi:uncharacterized repeat protein (TIGR01451 family)